MIDKDQRCQGCGAPIKGRTCEYCGRVFEVEYDTTETVLYANDVPIMVEKISSELDKWRYQASQERQTAFLLENLRKSTNVAVCPIFTTTKGECI